MELVGKVIDAETLVLENPLEKEDGVAAKDVTDAKFSVVLR
jgi:hypothetical protein